jgi:hypothetical protein
MVVFTQVHMNQTQVGSARASVHVIGAGQRG